MSKRNLILVLISLHILFVSFAINAADKTPLNFNATVFRQQHINIDPEIIRNWSMSEKNQRIKLPWFDGRFLHATVEETTISDQFNTVSAKINTQGLGTALLTIGKGALTGVIIHDNSSYRIRSTGNGVYSLTRLNLINVDYGNDVMVHFDDHVQKKLPAYSQRNDNQTNQPAFSTQIIEQVKNTHDLASKLIRTEDGSRIDILIAYTSEAASWAQRNGINIDAEINNMMDLTNKSLRYSGVQTVLHHVGTAQVDYSIMDPVEFKTDMEELKIGLSFQDLRLLRSQLKADLVSLLVFNGEQGMQYR